MECIKVTFLNQIKNKELEYLFGILDKSTSENEIMIIFKGKAYYSSQMAAFYMHFFIKILYMVQVFLNFKMATCNLN